MSYGIRKPSNYPMPLGQPDRNVFDEAAAVKEKEAWQHDETMLSAWETLTRAAKLRADHVLMGDLKRWLQKKRAELDADVQRVDL